MAPVAVVVQAPLEIMGLVLTAVVVEVVLQAQSQAHLSLVAVAVVVALVLVVAVQPVERVVVVLVEHQLETGHPEL